MKYHAPTQHEIAEVEQAIGFTLPAALIALYAGRGNGGFGPDHGLLGLASGHKTDQGDTALDLYRIFSSADPDDPNWSWPKNMFPILHIGCAIYCCVDLTTADNPVVRFDPNGFGPGDNWSGAFTIISSKLLSWLDGL